MVPWFPKVKQWNTMECVVCLVLSDLSQLGLGFTPKPWNHVRSEDPQKLGGDFWTPHESSLPCSQTLPVYTMYTPCLHTMCSPAGQVWSIMVKYLTKLSAISLPGKARPLGQVSSWFFFRCLLRFPGHGHLRSTNSHSWSTNDHGSLHQIWRNVISLNQVKESRSYLMQFIWTSLTVVPPSVGCLNHNQHCTVHAQFLPSIWNANS